MMHRCPSLSLAIQKGVKIEVDVLPGANHFYADHLDELIARIGGYLDTALTAPDFDPLS